MNEVSAGISLSFGTRDGRFLISPAEDSPGIVGLFMVHSDQTRSELGRFCSINDAIVAVARQETGYRPWDELSMEEVPSKVHDLASWNYQEFFGT